MIQALGYVTEPFDAASPGRLCRGRERWIEYETMSGDEDAASIHRLVCSGAIFTDDRARDARRGIEFAPISLWTIFGSLLGSGTCIAYCEEGQPHSIPEQAHGLEHYTVTRPGGSLREWVVRWHMPIEDEASLAIALSGGADVFFTIEQPSKEPSVIAHESPAIPPLADAEDGLPSLIGEELAKALFLLTGFRSEGRPNRYFQPWGIPETIPHVNALALLHRDKHGPALGVYRASTFDIDTELGKLGNEDTPVLLVPFAIPPMLARWDRALWELRQSWNAEELGEFPVPASISEPHHRSKPEEASNPEADEASTADSDAGGVANEE
ncbi:MAG: hypothetical protein CL930_08250 [Deltaproteobacteria bacterium]|nr:hypothetical protein [Deltaproteobacteria bacterium]